MSTQNIFVVVLLVGSAAALIALALYKKDYVKASISFRPFGFFLEAGSNQSNQKPDSLSDQTPRNL